MKKNEYKFVQIIISIIKKSYRNTFLKKQKLQQYTEKNTSNTYLTEKKLPATRI